MVKIELKVKSPQKNLVWQQSWLKIKVISTFKNKGDNMVTTTNV